MISHSYYGQYTSKIEPLTVMDFVDLVTLKCSFTFGLFSETKVTVQFEPKPLCFNPTTWNPSGAITVGRLVLAKSFAAVAPNKTSLNNPIGLPIIVLDG